MSDRIDELERNVEPHVEWLRQRLNVEGNGYEGGPDDRALLEVRMTVRQLATIARENAAEADKWRKAVTTRCHVHPSYRGIKRPLDSAKARLGCTCHEHYAAIAAVEQEEAE